MVTKNQIKLIHSLNQKKYRHKNKMFIAEGHKVIIEFLKSNFDAVYLFTTLPSLYHQFDIKTELISDAELQKISFLSTPNTSVAVFKIPDNKVLNLSGATLVLDGISDPGNMGTIIRLCDWFNISNIVCSKETSDIYNPKVIQSTMGSLARVNVHYTLLKEFISEAKCPVYGTFMVGKSIYKTSLNPNSIIVMGNEANGISPEIEALISDKITIPQFGNQTTESLNVATATAIILSEFRRDTI